MGLLRLMGNKSGVIKGLIKTISQLGTKLDIVGPLPSISALLATDILMTEHVSVRRAGPHRHLDTEPRVQREGALALPRQLPRPNFD